MGFDIPMNTKGALDSGSLLSLNGNGSNNQGMNTNFSGNNMQNNGMNNQGSYNQNNNFGNNMNNQSGYNQNNNFGNNMNNQGGYNQNNNNFGNNMNNQSGYNQNNNNFGNNMNNQNGYNQNNNFGNNMNNQGGYNQNSNFGNNMNNQNGYNQNNNFNNTASNQSANNNQRQNSGSGVHLKKGQKFALAGAGGAQLSKIKLGLGWDVLNQACDLDASAFMLDGQDRILNCDESWFVFYGQTVSPDGSVRHSGDSDGTGSGDDETIYINLDRVNPQVQKIAFVVTIDEALTRGLNFSMVQNAYVRILDDSNGAEIAKFNLTDYYSNVTAMVVGELYRNKGSWKFNPVGDGVAKDLAGLCAMYGVQVAD